MTLLLTRSDLEVLLDPGACPGALRRGFTAERDGTRALAAPIPAPSR